MSSTGSIAPLSTPRGTLREGAGPIGIVGGGAWGTALANVAASAGHDAILWLRDSALAKSLATERMNARFLPGVPLAAGIRPTRISRTFPASAASSS